MTPSDTPPPPSTGPAGTAPNPAYAPVPSARKRRRNPLVMLLIGLVMGFLLGGTGGYFAFNGRKVTISEPLPTPATSSASASATPSDTPSPVVTATPSPTSVPTAAPQGVLVCPVDTPPSWHHLGSPGGGTPAAGMDFCGRGAATIPTGTGRFLTSTNWKIGLADSCPPGTSGQSGMGTVLTITEVIPGGGAGPDQATGVGDWVDSGGQLMPAGGNFQLRVSTVAPDCVWHIAIFPT